MCYVLRAMYLSLNLLKEYVDLPKSLTSEQIGEALTMHTVEVEGIEKQSEQFEGVVVGKILEIAKHPNADRLQLVKVDNGKEILDIVCGAPNIEVGQFVPLAQVGTELSNGLVIKETEVRGEKSCGMLCAEDELGFGEDHAGIMILDKRAKIGQVFSEYLNLNDTVIEVDNKSLSNRPDLWGHIGIARELSAIFNVKFKNYKANSKILKGSKEINLKVKVEDFKMCQRYMAIVLDGISVGVSPKWMQEKLIAAGQKPINNIVDITNYVMIEFGQPMHAFDKSKVDNITVRSAEENEEIITLDGERRKLDSSMIVIADSKKVIAVAGVIGGINSEIDENTTSVVLEVANFDYVNIRKTSSKLNLRTEASMRFEKGLDPNLPELALIRAVELIKKCCKTVKVVSSVVDENEFKLNLGPIEIDKKWIDKIIGQKIEEKKIINILENLGFGIEAKDEIFSVTIPSWRATRDVAAKEDVVEEIIRIFGVNEIKSSIPVAELRVPACDEMRLLEKKIKMILIGSPALSEVYNYSFVGEKQLKKLGINSDDYIKLANPITSYHTLMRQNLAPNLIDNVKTNQARFESFGVFEIGKIFLDIEGGLNKGGESKNSLPYQEKRLGIALAGKNKQEIFLQAKGIVENLFSELSLDVMFDIVDEIGVWADSNYRAGIKVNNQNIGTIFAVSNDVSKKVGLKREAVIIEVRLDDLLTMFKISKNKMYKSLARFPALTRDLAFVINSKILYNDIRKEILDFDELIMEVELFDVYEGDKLGKGKKSLAFHIIYQADRTLKNKEVNVIQAKLLNRMEEKFGAKIRDF